MRVPSEVTRYFHPDAVRTLSVMAVILSSKSRITPVMSLRYLIFSSMGTCLGSLSILTSTTSSWASASASSIGSFRVFAAAFAIE